MKRALVEKYEVPAEQEQDAVAVEIRAGKAKPLRELSVVSVAGDARIDGWGSPEDDGDATLGRFFDDDGTLRAFDIDLSGTGVRTWHALRGILAHFPALRTLRANRLPLLAEDGDDADGTFPTVTELSLCGVSALPAGLLSAFPELRVLDLSSSPVALSAFFGGGGRLPAVAELRLGGCGLSGGLSALSARLEAPAVVRRLALPGNGIGSAWGGDARDGVAWAGLEELDLADNALTDWCEIDALDALPVLRALRVTGNALPSAADGELSTFHSTSLSAAEIVRETVIARLPRLERLNGSAIDAAEREAAERGYLRRVFAAEAPPTADAREWTPAPDAHPRYAELRRRRGPPPPRPKPGAAARLELRLWCDGIELRKAVPAAMSVPQLRQAAARMFGLDIAVQLRQDGRDITDDLLDLSSLSESEIIEVIPSM